MTSVSLTYLPVDFLNAWRLQLRHNNFIRLLRLAPLVMIGVFVISLWSAFAKSDLTLALGDLPMLLIGAGCLALHVLNDRVLLPRRAQQFLSQQRSMQGEVSIGWDGKGVTFVAATGQSRTAWGDYFKWLENEAVLVLFQSENLLNVLPKRSLTEAQAVEIRGYLTAALGKAGEKRKPASAPDAAAPSRP